MAMYSYSKRPLIILLLLTVSCVEPFKINLAKNKNFLVVEGTINDVETGQTIKINETNNYAANTYNSPVSKLTVEIIVNGGQKISLTEQGAGVYALPFLFKVETGNTYQLRFQKPDGTLYESGVEKANKVPDISKIYDEFVVNGLKGSFLDIPANYIYLDFEDTEGQSDYYLWTWKLWETQNICKTDYYDYYCTSKCWEILPNRDFIVFSDAYSNGKPVYGKLIAKIPYYSFDGALIEIKQQSVSQQVYKYFKLVSEQQQTNGTLVDTPPAAIVGNIKNTVDANEPVAGVFSVASIAKQKYWLSRKNGQGKAIPVGLLGRTPSLVPGGATFPCLEGLTRTPKKPEGWVD